MANRNPRGYTSPANLQLHPITIRLRPATIARFDAAAAAAGLSRRQAAERVFDEFATKHGVTTSPASPSPPMPAFDDDAFAIPPLPIQRAAPDKAAPHRPSAKSSRPVFDAARRAKVEIH